MTTEGAREKTTYRNRWTGATFTVVGPLAVERMAQLPSWEKVTK